MFKRLRRSEHEKVDELLSAYMDGELSVEEVTLVEKHLRQCSACAHDLESLHQTVNLVRKLPAVPPPRSFAISHLVLPERPWVRGYLYLRGATALAALLLIVLLAGDFGFQYLLAPRMAVPVPRPMALEPTVGAEEAEAEVAVETPPPREALDQMEARKVEEAPLVATPEAKTQGAALPSPEPTPTPESMAAAEPLLPLPTAEGTAHVGEEPERLLAFFPALRLLEGTLFGALLILGGATALLKWRRERTPNP